MVTLRVKSGIEFTVKVGVVHLKVVKDAVPGRSIGLRWLDTLSARSEEVENLRGLTLVFGELGQVVLDWCDRSLERLSPLRLGHLRHSPILGARKP